MQLEWLGRWPLNSLKHRVRQRSELVLKARLAPYTDGMISIDSLMCPRPHLSDIFVPEPLPNETIYSFAQARNISKMWKSLFLVMAIVLGQQGDIIRYNNTRWYNRHFRLLDRLSAKYHNEDHL